MGEQRRIFAVGDIHGCIRKLETLMDRLPIDADRDLLVFLGDYVNRGEHSQEVIEYLIDLGARIRHTVFLMGNHEHALLEYSGTCNLDYLQLLRTMGVEETLRSYSDAEVASLCGLSFMNSGHRRFLEELRPYHEEDGYLFIHAGIVPGEDFRRSRLDRVLSVRNVFLESNLKLDAVVVFGHTPFEMPFVTRDKIGIDTGAVYGNMLTAVELPRLRFYHA